MKQVAPSSKVLLSLAYTAAVYLLPDSWVVPALAPLPLIFLVLTERARREFVSDLLPKTLRFVGLLFAIRVAFELLSPEARADFSVETMVTGLTVAALAAARVFAMTTALGFTIASTTAAQVIEDLEAARATEQFRLYALIALQYPRQLARRHRLIEDAQRSRGQDPGKRIHERALFTMSIVMPLVQSELDTIGDRAALIHARGLDLPAHSVRGWAASRVTADWIFLVASLALVALAIVVRL